MKETKRDIAALLAGPVLFAACYTMLPQSLFATSASRAAIGMILWMAIWWITGPVDYAVTALLPIVLNALLQITDMSTVLADYSSETVILLLGASILSVAWEETGLDQRIAGWVLYVLGNNYRRQIIFWFLVSAALSAVLPNAIVCATLTPIAVAMLRYAGEDNIAESRIGSKILLTIAYAVGVGGIISPLGGAMNLVTVNYLEQLTGEEFLYIGWVIRFAPIATVLVVSNILFLIRDADKNITIATQARADRTQDVSWHMTRDEAISLVLFVIATVLAFTRQLYQQYIPSLKPAYVFLGCAVLSFVLLGRKGGKLRWKKAKNKIIWDMMLIFAGGMALGTLVNDSGAADAIGSAVQSMGLHGGFGTVAIIIFITIILSDITSNTATAAIAIPIVISIVQGMGLNAIPYVYIASIGVNLSYMLPTSIRAIPVGYGLSPRYMLKEGWKLTLIVWVLMTILAYVLLQYWDMFSMA